MEFLHLQLLLDYLQLSDVSLCNGETSNKTIVLFIFI